MFYLRAKKSYEIVIEKLDSEVISHSHNAQVFGVVAKALQGYYGLLICGRLQ